MKSGILLKYSLVLLMPLLIIVSLLIGEIDVSFGELVEVLTGGSESSLTNTVILHMRLPRVLLTIIVGGGLAACGAAMQSVFRNPLVEPGLVGISTGAALAAVVYIVFFQYVSVELYNVVGRFAMPLFTFIGALVATILVYRIGSIGRRTDVTLIILAGVAINALCMALTGLILYFADLAALREFTFWSFGSFANASWTTVAIGCVFVIGPILFILPLRSALNLFSLGEDQVNYSGFNAMRIKRAVIVLSAISIGGAVSVVGVIGFIGLVVPHIIRILMGPDNRKLIPYSIFLGALLTMFADLLAKGLLKNFISLFTSEPVLEGVELPVGMVTALMGAPFFIYLLISAKRKKLW